VTGQLASIPLHRRRVHSTPVEGCDGCRYASIQFAVPDRGQRAYAFQAKLDRENQTDREAYRRLRLDGLQPKAIAGSAELEQHAETPFEVAQGVIRRSQRGKQELAEALSICTDSGLDPLKATTGSPWAGH